jgi:hypothetical protein
VRENLSADPVVSEHILGGGEARSLQGLENAQRAQTVCWAKDRDDFFKKALRDADLTESKKDAFEHCYQLVVPVGYRPAHG